MTFIARQERFTCEHCGAEVEPLKNGSYRNHCPHCLYSKHVDREGPGDRASDCGGMMEPVGLTHRSGKGWMVVHRCLQCKKELPNTVAPDDNLALLSEAPRPYGRGISLMRHRKAAAEPGVAGGHFALRASRLHPHSSTGLRPWPPAESGEQGKLFFTTLFLVMVIIEWTDLVFAVDSIPAAFAISQDPFVIYTSNIFAILGLRAMFFLLEAVIHKFHHLQKGLSLVLFVIGAKMLLVMFGIHISSAVSFAAVMTCLLGSILLSVLFPKKF